MMRGGDVKARRRESSMMLMNMGPSLGSHGQQVVQAGMMGQGSQGVQQGGQMMNGGARPKRGERKSSMPTLRNPVGE